MYTLLLVNGDSTVQSTWYFRAFNNINNVLNDHPDVPVYTTKWPYGQRAFVLIRHHDMTPTVTITKVTRREIVE